MKTGGSQSRHGDGFTPSRCRVEALARDLRDPAAMVAPAGSGDPHR